MEYVVLKIMPTRRSDAADHKLLSSPDAIQLVKLRSTGGEDTATDGQVSPGVRPPPRNYHTRHHRDVVDHPGFFSAKNSYTYIDLLVGIISICTYLLDVGSDIYLACKYYMEGHWWWFGLTVTFIAVPSLTITLFSLAWYLQDRHTDSEGVVKNSRLQWVSRVMLLFLQLGPILRYVDTMIFGIRSKRAESQHEEALRQRWYKEKLYEDTDSALLRLIECCMEAAPQLTLQLYIMTVVGSQGGSFLAGAQATSCITSLVSIAWALTAYQKALRLSLEDKANLTFSGMVMIFIWRLLTVGARILALALFASAFGYWIAILVAGHYFVVFFWILVQHTRFCATRCQEFFFNLVVAAISIFCFFNLVEGYTRLRCIFYYLLVYAENMAMVVAWYSVRGTANEWYVVPSMVAVLGLFFVGIMFQLAYYVFCHPNNRGHNHYKRIRWWVPCDELWYYAMLGRKSDEVTTGQPPRFPPARFSCCGRQCCYCCGICCGALGVDLED